MIDDLCKFFRDIEADPTKIVKITVKDYLAIKRHTQDCDSCYNIVLRVDSIKPHNDIPFGRN